MLSISEGLVVKASTKRKKRVAAFELDRLVRQSDLVEMLLSLQLLSNLLEQG
jgi:hypothetical protein